MSKPAHLVLNIPERYQGKALVVGDQKHKKALEAFRKGKSLLLLGPCGNGKTHLAIVLTQEWLADKLSLNDKGRLLVPHHRAKFVSVPELLMEIKASWDERENTRTENEAEIMKRYSQAPLLVLDDLGAERPSEWSRSVLYNIINRRYLDCLQTIVTTNLTHDDLAGFDDRIASRLCEMGEVMDLGEKDWRVG